MPWTGRRTKSLSSCLLPVADALARILAAVPLMPGEEAPVSGALGRVTAEPVRARRTQPPVAMSAMDGYAVRAEDVGSVPATLTRVGDAPAGGAYKGTVTAGEAVRIFTGGPVPDGARHIHGHGQTDDDSDHGLPEPATRIALNPRDQFAE